MTCYLIFSSNTPCNQYLWKCNTCTWVPPKVISYSVRGKRGSGPATCSFKKHWLTLPYRQECHLQQWELARRGVTCPPAGSSSSEGMGRRPPRSPSQWGSRLGLLHFTSNQHRWVLTPVPGITPHAGQTGTRTTLGSSLCGRHRFTDRGQGCFLKLCNLAGNFILLLFKPTYPLGLPSLPQHFSCANGVCVDVCVYLYAGYVHIYVPTMYIYAIAKINPILLASVFKFGMLTAGCILACKILLYLSFLSLFFCMD